MIKMNINSPNTKNNNTNNDILENSGSKRPINEVQAVYDVNQPNKNQLI